MDRTDSHEDYKKNPIHEEIAEFRKFIGKIVPFVKKLKNTPTIFPLYFFYFAFGMSFLISLALYNRLGYWEVSFYISETAQQVYFPLPLGEIVGVLLLGGVFSLSALRAFELLRSQVDPHKKSYAKRLFLVIFYVVFMIILILGTFSHMIGNQLHEYIYEIEETQTIVPGTPLGNLKAGIYLWDEILSHLFIGIGFYGMLYINIYLDLINDNDLTIRTDEFVNIFIGSAILGMGICLGFIEGQASIVFFIVSLVLIVAIVGVMHKNKMKYRRNPFVFAGLVMSLFYVITEIIYVALTGWKPYYPYVYQLTELGLF